MIKTILVIIAILLVLMMVGFLVIGRERSWALLAGEPGRKAYDFAKAQRSPTENDALACSIGLCPNPDFDVPTRDAAPADTILALERKLLDGDPLARRVDDRSDETRARFVTYSPLMRFPDVIHLEAETLPDGRTGIRAYARAQLGRKDFGKNRARLERLLSAD